MSIKATRSNDGQALIASVVIVASVLAIVGGFLFLTAASNITQSTHSADLAQAAEAAHSGIDLAYEAIQAPAHANTVPCGKGAVSGSLGSNPPSSYSVTVTYFSATTSTTPLTCAKVATGTEPQSVKLTSVGTSTHQSQTMISGATLSVGATTTQVFGDATYTGGTLELNGADTFKIAGRLMYVKGNASCGSGAVVDGTLAVSGSLTMSGNCTITGGVVTKGKITALSGGPSVGGSLASADPTATPDITITGNPSFHTVLARTTVSHPSWWKVSSGSNIVQHDTSVVPPKTQPFPTLVWTPTGWVKAGYNTVTAGSTCARAYAAIFATHTATPKGEAVYTTCKIALKPPSKTDCPSWQKYYCPHVVLNRNLAVFSTAGFTIIGTGSIESGSSTTGHDLVLAVPSTTQAGVAETCSSSSGNVNMANSGRVGANVDTLIYTPCSVKMSGAASLAEGEVYVNGTFAPLNGMSFGAPFTVPGSSGGTSSSGSGTPVTEGPATVGVTYERTT
jgi:hypothetical protein